MTIPLTILPPVFSAIFKMKTVQIGHPFASVCVIIAAAAAHLLAYGAKSIRFPGLKRLIFPATSTSPLRAVMMELIFAVLHFGSIVLVYRLALGEFSAVRETIAVPSLLSALMWLLGVFTFILVKYPDSLRDDKTIEQRRVIHGLLLMLALQGGLLM